MTKREHDIHKAHTLKAGATTVYTRHDPAKETEKTPAKKIALEKLDAELTLKAEEREPTCWSYGCDRAAHKWVREIQFDIKGSKVGADNAVVSTRDLGGPAPGFCFGHDAAGPMALAEAVYHMKEEFKWGLPVTRWWVIYTDGTKTGGEVHALNLGPGYVVKDEHSH